MLLDGDHWRAHQRQIFHFENGAWVMKGSLDIVAWDNLLALEGLFIQLALKVQAENVAISWSWDEAKHYILDIVGDNVEANGIAKDNSDHLRASTANKTWQARWTRRCADMMAQLRKSWEEEKPKHVLSKLFLSEWDTPMPRSKGICFDDVYLNEVWEITPKSPETNCYFKLDYNYYYEFLQSVYYKNDHLFQLKLAFMHAAFLGKCTAKMIFEIGRGGDGKGMEAVLDTALFGNEASATLDCGVFLDRMEFRKSAELAWNKACIRVQEMDRSDHFVADIWKRFVVDEEIDCRVNYGLTSKRSFGSALKVQEFNFENIPVIEESRDRQKSCEQLRRRVVCFMMGKATYTTRDELVNPKEGTFRYIPQDELKSFLSHPVTAAIFLRDWCIPFFQDNSIQECLDMINDLEAVHPDVERDTPWLALCLSGSSTPPPGDIIDMVSESNERVLDAHEATPWKRVIREYLILKVESLPGHMSSYKGKANQDVIFRGSS